MGDDQWIEKGSSTQKGLIPRYVMKQKAMDNKVTNA